MVGYTNARGVTQSELTDSLNGYGQTLMGGFDSLQFQINELREQYDRARNNPHLGAVVNYAGFDWIVCHLDYENGAYYLALKDIYEMTKFSESGSTSFRNSLLEERLNRFENILSVFSRGLVRDPGTEELELVSFNDGIARRAFVPSYEQITDEFDLFKGKNFGRLVAKYPERFTDSTFTQQGYGLSEDVAVRHANCDWWTCTPGTRGNVLTIDHTGRYTTNTTVSDPTSERGFRPFVLMKMR